MTALMTMEHAGGDGTGPDVANDSRRWWILAVLGIAQLMVVLDSTIVNIALPTAQHDLGFSNADRQWIVTAYSLTFGSLLLLGGRIGDRFGRKRALIIGLVGFAAASAIGGASVNFAMLVIARTVQGAFGALLAPSVLALLTTTFTDPGERGKAFGLYGAIAGAGGALGLLLGGILTSYASWRWTLFVNLLFAAIAIAGALLWLKTDQVTDRDPFDLPGLFLVAGGLFSLVFGFSHAETTSWSDPFTIGFLVAGVVLLATFASFETRAKYPLLPPRVVRNRTRGGSVLAMLFASVGLFGVFLFLTYYLQDTLGFSPVKTGLAFLPLVAVLASTAQVSNRILLPRRAQADRADRVAHLRCGVVRTAPGRVALVLCQPRASLSHRVGNRVRAERRPLLQHRYPRLGAPRRRSRIGHPQHSPTGGRLHRHVAAQHTGSQCCHFLLGRSGDDPGQSSGGPPPQLHDGVPVVLTDLRGRGNRRRVDTAARRPDVACVRTHDQDGRPWIRGTTSNPHLPRTGGVSVKPPLGRRRWSSGFLRAVSETRLTG